MANGDPKLPEDRMTDEQVNKFAETSRFNRLGTFLDPTGLTNLGIVGPGMNRMLDFTGLWKPGNDHPYWGPVGDFNTPFNGVPKWCVLVVAQRMDDQTTEYIQAYRGRPLNCPGGSSGVHLYAVMNDDWFQDNTTYPLNPMRSTI